MKKLLLIVNPRAGKNKSREPLYDAIVRLSEGGYLVHVAETKASGDATRYAREMGPCFDTVACYGGDGTLNETISGLMQLTKKPLLGYLPTGSKMLLPASSAISMAGMSSDHTDAAIITPAAKPRNTFCVVWDRSFLKKNTMAAPQDR